MPPDANSQLEPLLPVSSTAAPPVSTLPSSQPLATGTAAPEDGQTAASFLPVLGLLIFGVGAGWIIGKYDGSFLWMLPAIMTISGLAHRRISHFRKYLLHAIIRTGEKERIDGHMETTEWINTVLERFWTVFEPELSKQVIEKVNIVMKDQKPGFLDKLELREFTLGSNPPCVLGARGYSRTLPNMIHLDMDLCFYPAELSEESRQTIIRMRPSFAEEQPVQWNSKIVVVARIGKGIVGVDVPVMIKEVSFMGKLRVQMELMGGMPLLKQVQLSFLETPKIDFVLRPLKAIDLMDLPGLSNWMMSMINDNVEAQLVSPNRITINVAGNIDKIRTGVLKVKIAGTQGLAFGPAAEPFIRFELNGKMRGSTPRALEGASIHGRLFIMTRALSKPLIMHVMKSPQEEIGIATYPLEALSEQIQLENLTSDVVGPDGTVLGQVNFNLAYVTAEDVLDPEADLNSAECGVFSVQVQRGEKLTPVGKGDRKIYVEAWVHPKKIEHDPAKPYSDADPTCYRFGATLMKAKEAAVWDGEPEWEVYLEKASKSQVTLLLKDAETDELYGRWTAPVKKLLNRADWFSIGADGRIKLGFAFRPTGSSDASEEDSAVMSVPALGVARLKILGASGLEAKKAYFATAEVKETEVEIGRTGKSSETSAPVWNKTILWPVSRIADILRLEVYAKDIFKDPMVAALDILISEAAEKHPNETVQREEALLDKKGKQLEDGESIRYELGFFPVCVSEAREALIASGAEYPLIPADMPPESNCVLFSVEQVSVRSINGSAVYVEISLDDDDEPLAKTAAQPSKPDGISWKMFAEKLVREPEDVQLHINLKEDHKLGAADALGSLSLKLGEANVGHWYKTRSGVEIMFQATCKPLKMQMPTEADNIGVLKVEIKEAHSLLAVDEGDTSDPFAVFRLNAAKVYKTEVVKKCLDPVWNEAFQTEIRHRDRDVLNIDFRDWNRVAVSRTLGQLNIDLSQLPPGQWQDLDLPLENTSTGTARLRLRFDPSATGAGKMRAAAGNVVAAPAKAFSKLGDKLTGGNTGVDEEKKEKGKVGSFFSSMGDKVSSAGDKMTGKSKEKEQESPPPQTKATPSPVPQASPGPKAPSANVATAAAVAAPSKPPSIQSANFDGEPALSIQLLEVRVTGHSKPLDVRIKVKEGDKTFFKSDELKNTMSPSFRTKHLTDCAFLLPEASEKPITFALHWSLKSEPSTPEVTFDPEAMEVIEELEDSAIALLHFPVKSPEGVKASVLFKFAEADAATLKALRPSSAGKMFSSFAQKINK